MAAFVSPTPITRAFTSGLPERPYIKPRTCPKCCSAADTGEAPREPAKRRRRPMSAEARAKISAALKGRRKSESHRANLRRRFGGDQNPMYGRKLSAESRAKISRAMTARGQKKVEERQGIDDAVLEGLREKALGSRLVESRNFPRKRPGRRLIDERGGKDVDKILDKVGRGDAPPENVVRMRENTEKRRFEKVEEERRSCGVCDGSGLVPCAECVGAFGVVSGRCEVCFGAGASFCDACEGAGVELD